MTPADEETTPITESGMDLVLGSGRRLIVDADVDALAQRMRSYPLGAGIHAIHIFHDRQAGAAILVAVSVVCWRSASRGELLSYNLHSVRETRRPRIPHRVARRRAPSIG